MDDTEGAPIDDVEDETLYQWLKCTDDEFLPGEYSADLEVQNVG